MPYEYCIYYEISKTEIRIEDLQQIFGHIVQMYFVSVDVTNNTGRT
jgi:hypothetical protein